MAEIQLFSRLRTGENIVTNNTMLLFDRIYRTDIAFFRRFLNRLVDSDALEIGPSFAQQRGAGGSGIPDGLIEQRSFKIVIETKLFDTYFWGKEDYASHFRNEDTRILFTLSKNGMNETRKVQMVEALKKYDSETSAIGATFHIDQTFIGLLSAFRQTIDDTRTRFKIELEELVDAFESFATEEGLIRDEHLRMHVFAINTSEDDNIGYTLYYNQAYRNESPHKFVGLYRDKTIKYVAETKVIVIPTRKEDGTYNYQILKGASDWNDSRRQQLETFLDDEGWGFDGNVKFHLFDNMYKTDFRKISPYGIMGPRHFWLPDYLDSIPSAFDAEWLASTLSNKTWE